MRRSWKIVLFSVIAVWVLCRSGESFYEHILLQRAESRVLSAREFRETIESVLREMDMKTEGRYRFYSREAVNLLLGTALHESMGLRKRKPLDGGEGRGLFQMEPETYHDISKRYLSGREPLANAMRVMFLPRYGRLHSFRRLIDDDRYAIAMARLKYYQVKRKIPASLRGQAAYWKRYFNTHHGRGDEEQYLKSWMLYGGNEAALK